MRIASLLSSTTEIVCALGLRDQLVGVTFECDYPVGVREGLPILVGGLDTHAMTAGQIDEAVRAAAAAGTPMYQLDQNGFAACNPELVLTQDLCRVCALPAGDVADALAHLGCAAIVVSHDPHTLDEVIESINTIGSAAGVLEQARVLTESLHVRLDALRASVASRPTPRPRVFVLEWTDPPFLSGHWVPDLVLAAGGDPVLARSGERSTATTWEAIAGAQPDVVIVAPCGYGLDDASTMAEGVVALLPAAAEVWAIDANSFMVRPGPRLVDGAEHLASILHGIGTRDQNAVRRISS
jgi:iron complex transport system substrate-binding protein